MPVLTTAEIVQIVIALIEHAPEFVRFVQELKLKGRPLTAVPDEHRKQLQVALASLQTSATSPNEIVNAVAEHMGAR